MSLYLYTAENRRFYYIDGKLYPLVRLGTLNLIPEVTVFGLGFKARMAGLYVLAELDTVRQ